MWNQYNKILSRHTNNDIGEIGAFYQQEFLETYRDSINSTLVWNNGNSKRYDDMTLWEVIGTLVSYFIARK